MKVTIKITLCALFLGLGLAAFAPAEEKVRYKCLVQVKNYTGEGAYVITSLLNPQGKYAETLFILGEDDEWYHEIDEWWSYFGKKKRNVDGITGATVSGGERKVIAFEIAKSKIDAGYTIRFETSVEDQKYYPADLEVPLTSNLPKESIKGSGYIRYVRIMPN